jgi:hypothetical protein
MRLDDVPVLPAHAGLCSSSLPDWACTAFDVVAAVLSSPFVLSLLGAAAGACTGAAVATRLVARRQRRDDLAAEIRSTNVATMVALSICHKALGLKRGHVLPLAERYASDRAGFIEFARQRRTGERQGNAAPPVVLDPRAVPSLTFPIVTLQRLLFDKISMFGRSLALMTTLSETAGWLTNANAKRNELLDRAHRIANPAELAQFYFGGSAPATRDYPDTLQAVVDRTDELIFFSATLCHDLAAHAQSLRQAWTREFGVRDLPEITAVDFTAARQNGLMPAEERFAEWLAGLDRQIVNDPRL